jgi:hypothetical protein
VTTTLGAIRDEQQALIEALTPKQHSERKFEISLDEIDFRDWAVAHPRACWRRFAIQDLWDYDVPEVTGGDMQFEPARVEVVIAYPRSPALYGLDNARDMRDMMRQDADQIAYAIGMWGTGNMSDSSAVRESLEYETGDEVVLSVATYRVYFYRATTGDTYVASQNSSEQSFQYTTTSSTDSYTVTIPKAMVDTSYVVEATISTLGSGGSYALLKAANSGRTTTQFTLDCSGALATGTIIDIIVRDRA